MDSSGYLHSVEAVGVTFQLRQDTARLSLTSDADTRMGLVFCSSLACAHASVPPLCDSQTAFTIVTPAATTPSIAEDTEPPLGQNPPYTLLMLATAGLMAFAATQFSPQTASDVHAPPTSSFILTE
ncbi:MAG: hypothetical protein ABS52_18430 [Gemmatimonadetes bacterium SCN 70-22]|nr:MAG: hypothetical protein ABS52_18430 [Gemmatimonadetes bacterium SCN 70-22]